jgi:ankyrin repeat protein
MSALEQMIGAIERGDMNLVQSLVESGAVDASARLPAHDAMPVLVLAARQGRKDIVEYLVKQGAATDDTNGFGTTACMAATAAGHADIVALLIAHGANLGLRNNVGVSALVTAVNFHYERIAKLLIDSGAPLGEDTNSELMRVAAMSVDVIRALTDRRHIDICGLCVDGQRTPLHWAGGSDRATVEHLVNVCGIDLEMRDAKGETCTFAATENGRADLLRCFIGAGADVHVGDANDVTPFHAACSAGSEECALLLLAAGSDVTARDSMGRTASHCAANVDLVHVLLAVNADFDAPDHSGVTARQKHAKRRLLAPRHAPTPADLHALRCCIAKIRLDFVRNRAFQVCVGLQSRGLDALQMCEILQHACGPLAPLIPFHIWWNIATTVKHVTNHKSQAI